MNEEIKNINCSIDEMRDNLEKLLIEKVITEDEFRERFITGMNTILYNECGLEYIVKDENEE